MTATANSHSNTAKPQQLLLRLPDDLAERFAQVVPSRQRGRFLLDLLRSELDRESLALEQAAKTLTAMETAQPDLDVDMQQWVEAPLASVDDDDFNAEEFEREFAKAQTKANTP